MFVDQNLYTTRPQDARTPNEEKVYDALQALHISFFRADHDAADTMEDCAAAKAAGLETILVTDCLINESCTPIAAYKNTTFADLLNVIRRTVKESI